MLIKKLSLALCVFGLSLGAKAYEFSDLPYDESHDFVFDKVFSASFSGWDEQRQNVAHNSVVLFVKGWRRVASANEPNGFISDTLTLFNGEFVFDQNFSDVIEREPVLARNCQSQINLVKAAPEKWDLVIRIAYVTTSEGPTTAVERMYCEAINQETTRQYYTALEQQSPQVISQSRSRDERRLQSLN